MNGRFAGRRFLGASLAGLAAVVAVAATVLLLIPREPEVEPVVVDRPSPGEVRPDYLPDGTPIWVVGHDDGDVSVLSGFDTHIPFGLNKLLWWCEKADGFENPEHGSKYDEYGLKIGGPAPHGLRSYELNDDGRITLGRFRGGMPPDTPHSGPPVQNRTWCTGFDDGTTWHTFTGWETWDSPTAAVEAQPTGWILLSGQLVVVAGEVRFCSLAGCEASVHVTNVTMPPNPDMEFGPFEGERFIARVSEGGLDDLTRVAPGE